jgi:hypothetical protein
MGVGGGGAGAIATRTTAHRDGVVVNDEEEGALGVILVEVI